SAKTTIDLAPPPSTRMVDSTPMPAVTPSLAPAASVDLAVVDSGAVDLGAAPLVEALRRISTLRTSLGPLLEVLAEVLVGGAILSKSRFSSVRTSKYRTTSHSWSLPRERPKR